MELNLCEDLELIAMMLGTQSFAISFVNEVAEIVETFQIKACYLRKSHNL